MPGLLKRMRTAGRHLFGYDAVATTNRRRPPITRTRGEDAETTASQRKAMIGTTRDLKRNFSVAAWAVRKHLDFTSTFHFQAKTNIDTLDERMEALVEWWSRPANCDVAGRHPLSRLIRLLEACAVTDGDAMILKLRDGRIQAIEGDRIKTPDSGLPASVDAKELIHGIRVGNGGQVQGYILCKRVGDQLAFERLLRPEFVEHHGYFDRIDQVRGISPLAPAINLFQDVYEGATYALAKMKVTQLFGLVTKRGEKDSIGGAVTGTDTNGDGVNDQFSVDFGRGNFHLDIGTQDDAKFIESQTPSMEFQQFANTVIAMGLKSLDIPYSFYDESHTNFYGSRGALLQYQQSVDIKRANLRNLLDRLTRWRLGLFIQDGILELPRGLTIADLKWDWIPAGLPWWNPLQEIKADIAAIEYGLNTRQDILREQGKDFYEVADKLAAENSYLKERGLMNATPSISSSGNGETNE